MYFQPIVNIYFTSESMSMHPELSGCITTLTVRNTEVANFCTAMDTLIDQDDVHDERHWVKKLRGFRVAKVLIAWVRWGVNWSIIYHSKRVFNAFACKIKIRQIHTKCAIFYSTFNRSFCETQGIFSLVFQSHFQTFCWSIFFGALHS